MTSQSVLAFDISRPAQGGTSPARSDTNSGADFLSFLVSAEPVAPHSSGSTAESGQQLDDAETPEGEEKDSREETIPACLLMTSAPAPAAPPGPLQLFVQANPETGGLGLGSEPSPEASPSASTAPAAHAGPTAPPALASSPNSETPETSTVPTPPTVQAAGERSSGDASSHAPTLPQSAETSVRVNSNVPSVPMDRPAPQALETSAALAQGDFETNSSDAGATRVTPAPLSRVVPEPATALAPAPAKADPLPAPNSSIAGGPPPEAQVPAHDAVSSVRAPLPPVTPVVPEPVRVEPAPPETAAPPRSEAVPAERPTDPGTEASYRFSITQPTQVESVKALNMPVSSAPLSTQAESEPEGGTPAAEPSNTTMVTPQENKTAGSARKNLPTSTPVMSVEADSAESAPRLPKVHSVEGRESSLFAAYRESAAVAESRSEEVISMPVSFEAVEKAQALINEAAVRIHKREGATLEVTIKPDADTELSLHIRFHAGQIEARAVCQRGDFSALQSDWSELQDRLAKQGIKLSGLETAGQQSFNGSTGQNPGHRRSTPDVVPEMPVFAGPVHRNSKPTEQPARRSPSGNAWESWA